MSATTQLPIMVYKSRQDLRLWLEQNHSTSKGVLVQIYKKSVKKESVTFEDVLKEGLCFGWSESKRLKGNDESYLQQFSPRRIKGTVSNRNKCLIKQLIEEKLMTSAGLLVLDC